MVWRKRHTLYLFGNGLSLAFNPGHYDLAALTGRVQKRLGKMAGSRGSHSMSCNR